MRKMQTRSATNLDEGDSDDVSSVDELEDDAAQRAQLPRPETLIRSLKRRTIAFVRGLKWLESKYEDPSDPHNVANTSVS